MTAVCDRPKTLNNCGNADDSPLLQALFYTYGGMEPDTASLVAEMLGFNPDLVMPQLRRELNAVQQTDPAPNA